MSHTIQEDAQLVSQGFGLKPPSANYAIESIEKFIGQENAQSLWAKACQTAGIALSSSSPESLEKVFRVLSKEAGAVGVLGRSLSIRALSYRKLNESSLE